MSEPPDAPHIEQHNRALQPGFQSINGTTSQPLQLLNEMRLPPFLHRPLVDIVLISLLSSSAKTGNSTEFCFSSGYMAHSLYLNPGSGSRARLPSTGIATALLRRARRKIPPAACGVSTSRADTHYLFGSKALNG
ncbi:hypothetical protein ASPBRDRAFT_38711 [Aspergillus brasiliensis CBS 101740]|uniref:Uncharacterized protein n=1 Tax=Aspergillus brasiliensis (strain CBS 101740 / IMI 381727 / IBT 21946) TaxID=767769 RepID=A0A1L9UX56_ASPBC|nr:hypothetical protein ASPBRDRAFT_38711 [Aspergillus brasiliensis CBS 101740]